MTKLATHPPINDLYETDFHAWTQEQARLLRERRWDDLDLENLIDEVEGVGSSERREIRSRTTSLLAHLLKWKFQPGHRGPSWAATIAEQRDQLVDIVKTSPSLGDTCTLKSSRDTSAGVFWPLRRPASRSASSPRRAPSRPSKRWIPTFSPKTATWNDIMLRATSIVRKPAVRPERVADRVTLDHEGRNRRRIALKGEGGLDFLLDLERATVLNDGDAVKLEDGRLVQVQAAPQRLLEVRAENPLRLLRMAWHIGNRHAAAEITADALYIEDDPVLAEMVRGQGGTATPVVRPFQPERGAYEHDCGHDHGHHGHVHEHGHPAHDHAHGPGCGHDHHAHDHHHGHAHDH